MFKESNNFKKFESKVWLSSPTMHGPEIEYVKEAYETNWMSTVGKTAAIAVLFRVSHNGCLSDITISFVISYTRISYISPVPFHPEHLPSFRF